MARFKIANHELAIEAVKEGMKLYPSLICRDCYSQQGRFTVWCGEERGSIDVKVLSDFENFEGVFDTPEVNWEEGYITINKK